MKHLSLPSRGLRARQLAIAAAATAALALAAGPAAADPGQGMKHAAPGAGFDQMIPHLLANAKASLNLNTSQQLAWDNAVAATKSAHETGRANRQQLKTALAAELATAEPNLAAVAATADAVEQQNRTLRHQVRDQWLALYATFSPEQKAVVKSLIQERLAKAESFRERMREKFRGMMQQPG
jgi:Spy/CpxP family protein refolding chaperone